MRKKKRRVKKGAIVEIIKIGKDDAWFPVRHRVLGRRFRVRSVNYPTKGPWFSICVEAINKKPGDPWCFRKAMVKVVT